MEAVKRLFNEPVPDFHLPQLAYHPLDDALDEMELLGFTLCNPFDLVDDDGADCIPAVQMAQYAGKTVNMLGYLITWKPVQTIRRELMFFGTFIDAAGDWLDTVHFADSVKAFPLQGKGFYRMQGIVLEEFGVFNLDVRRLQKRGIKNRAAARAGQVYAAQKNWQQGLIKRE